MAAGIAERVARVQAVLALTTRGRHEVDDRLHAIGGHERSMVSGMSRLTAGLSPTLPAATPLTLSASKAIG
jgi:hypothetical protein